MRESNKELFVRLLASHERTIYAYILSLVPNWADADDIFQETNIRLLRDFGKFDPNSSFAAWAIRVAYYQVLTWRKRAARRQLIFDDDVLRSIAERHKAFIPHAEFRQSALSECIKHLSTPSRELLGHCYAPDARVKEVAKTLRRTAPAVYKSLQRIRSALRECVERRMRSEKD